MLITFTLLALTATVTASTCGDVRNQYSKTCCRKPADTPFAAPRFADDAVITNDAAATACGQQILAAGGNAFDAVAATMLCIGVCCFLCEPIN